MDAFLQRFEHLKIPLEEIISATNNFDAENRIGVGGFGKVYKGEVSHSKGRSMAAIKRFDPKQGQGIPEFFREITTLSSYTHENLISLLGFCNQGHEMILVYEYASRGSLDRHLNSPHLTWMQRLKICLDIAKGLSHLHNPRNTHQRLIHCDVKSANILLDDQWNGKVSDFGLSIIGPANEQQSFIVTLAAGTPGYYDPQYVMTHTLTKESDVYSFGVVLFEVLCGRLCCTYSNGLAQEVLVPTWIKSYEQKKLIDIIFKHPTIQPIDQISLETFSDIAYRCLKESREDRPTMAQVVTELEAAIEYQEFTGWEPVFDYEEMIKSAKPPLNYRSKSELRRLLSKGVLINSGKTWFSLNKKEEHCVLVPLRECLDPAPSRFYKPSSADNSRFDVSINAFYSGNQKFKTHVKTQFLSPGITYTVNLVFELSNYNPGSPVYQRFFEDHRRKNQHIDLKYRLQGETKTSIAYLADTREDGWWMAELYQLTSDHNIVDFEILFDGFNKHFVPSIDVKGIEFRPLEEVEQEDDNQLILDSDANWEAKLPTDYEDIMKRSINSVQWTTNKEAYSTICKGFLINYDNKRNIWFSLDKNGKKCHMLSAVDVCYPRKDKLCLPESRFGEAVLFDDRSFTIGCEIQSQVVSSETTYAAYLVYKWQKDQSIYEAPIEVHNEGLFSEYVVNSSWYIYLVSPQTPVIRAKANQNTHNPPTWPRIKGLPQQRNDGWMEVQITEFPIANTCNNSYKSLKFTTFGGEKLRGLVIEGVEFRPI